MSSGYDEAVATLYQAPHEGFVAERKRLAAQLKSSGDAAGAARLVKLARPSVSAWVVNQLWWHESATFREMFATAEQLRGGKLAASAPHRHAMAALVARARKLLGEGGHAANEATVRRVQMTLSGLSAAGGFAPEPEGALTKDRDPPGVEAFGMMAFGDAAAERVPPVPHRDTPERGAHATRAPDDQAERRALAERREREAAEKKRIAEGRARRHALQLELEKAVRDAERELDAREREKERAASDLALAERALELARSAVETAKTRLAKVKED